MRPKITKITKIVQRSQNTKKKWRIGCQTGNESESCGLNPRKKLLYVSRVAFFPHGPSSSFFLHPHF